MPGLPDVVYWDEERGEFGILPEAAAMSRVHTFRLEKWWACQPGRNTRVAVVARTVAGIVKSVRLESVPRNVVVLPGAAIGLVLYRGRAWPFFWRVRCELL